MGLSLPGGAQNGTGEPVVLTKAEDIRALSADEALSGREVRIQGVVTLIYLTGTFFVQDETGGVLINTSKDTDALVPGDVLQIEGRSDYGFMVPRVAPIAWRKVGRAPLPEPVRISSDDLAVGRHISEWVELCGVVRNAVIGLEGRCVLHIDMGARVVEVQLMKGSLSEGWSLVDTRVKVRGVVAGYVNSRRQLTELYVRAGGFENIEVVEPAPADVFDIPTTSADALMMFTPSGHSAHRVKLEGVVTGHEVGRALYLRDDSQGIVVFSDQSEPLMPGDVAEVVGFPEMGPTKPRLRDAVIRKVRTGPPPSSVEATYLELLEGGLDGELVSLEGKFVSIARAPSVVTLVLDVGGMFLRTRLSPTESEAGWQPGSHLRVTGICRVEHAQLPLKHIVVAASDAELWLRGPADVVVTRSAPWWTPRRLLIVVVVVALFGSGALVWGAMLRRRVQEQTVVIRNQVHHEAISAERHRIAREFHDTVEQELAGLVVRLDALGLKVKDSSAKVLVNALQRLAHRLQDEARHFIWNLREHRWERLMLNEALPDVVAERHQDDPQSIEFVTEGEPRRLEGVISHHLLRIGQEAVTNAVHHATATRVIVTLKFLPESMEIVVTDDGCGFDAESAIERKAGHFGIVGMRERARRIGGALSLQSAAGQGTTVSIRVNSTIAH